MSTIVDHHVWTVSIDDEIDSTWSDREDAMSRCRATRLNIQPLYGSWHEALVGPDDPEDAAWTLIGLDTVVSVEKVSVHRLVRADS